MNSEISGNLVVHLVKKYLLLVFLVSALVGVGVSYLGVWMGENMYVSSGELVQNDSNYNLIASYSQFATSKQFNSLLQKEVNSSGWKDYSKKNDYSVSIASSGGTTTPFFTLKAFSNNKKYSEFLTNKSITVFITNIGKYLSGANITVVSRASNAKLQGFKSKIVKWFIYGFVITFIISSIGFILKYLFVGNVRDETFIEDVFDVKMLGKIQLPEGKE